MFPPGSFIVRECREDYVTSTGHTIPAGITVGVPIYAIHHMDEYYENPSEFNPDRFSPDVKANRNPLTFLPFVYGPRNCIGMRFALLEIKLTLAMLLKNFEFSPCDKTEIPLSVASLSGLLKPKNPVWLTIKSRQS